MGKEIGIAIAADWAQVRKQPVCSLPIGIGKTLVAVLWLKSLFDAGKVKNALILEPTRLLINRQVTMSDINDADDDKGVKQAARKCN